VFPGGIGALVRKDAPTRLPEILADQRSARPNWRAQSGQLLSTQIFSVVKGGTAEPWLGRKMNEFRLTATVTPVPDFSAGVQAVVDRHANVFFADRTVLTDAVAHNPAGSQLMVVDRYFTYEPRSLVFARGDETFRQVVDRALSRELASAEFAALYRQWFGEPGPEAQAFFRWTVKPE
jgi:putrescine:ornithine antiporter